MKATIINEFGELTLQLIQHAKKTNCMTDLRVIKECVQVIAELPEFRKNTVKIDIKTPPQPVNPMEQFVGKIPTLRQIIDDAVERSINQARRDV